MAIFSIKPENECRFDLITLGEVMLRMDPGDNRIHTTRQFNVWEGGGEYNAGKGLRRCFGKRVSVITALVDNPVGRLVEDLILQGGVDTSLIQWKAFDGIGRSARNGMYFLEKGFGIRGVLGCSDRGYTAVSMMKKGDIDWDLIFGEMGVGWFHTGGVFAGLSQTSADVIEEAMICARKYGTIVSYDLNYRSSLWEAFGGRKKAQQVNRRLARHADVVIGLDILTDAPMDSESYFALDLPQKEEIFKEMTQQALIDFPNLKVVATTLRKVKSASINDWGGILWADGQFFSSPIYDDLEIFDRVGGGDSFVSGLIYGFLNGDNPQRAVNYGAAHGALAMTTPGDTTMAVKTEVENIMKGAGAGATR